ncbi:purine permease 11 [Hibiscus trionum]|uniref:Probable purine permease n=1 Tax=Hibiscus trionum TaxID=183268 RepID=A0A9W7INE5_HIBTR|nr:purine permease 11 [Hibiscus trionum]
MNDDREPFLIVDENQSPFLKLGRWQWWLTVAINILFLVVGQAAAVLLGRFYFDQGGNSKWMATFVQNAGFPILFIPLFLLHPSRKLETSTTSSTSPPIKVVALLYFVLGLVIAGDNMLYSVGLLYLSASTYSLIRATQLAFNAVFSYFLNSQKMTALILNSVVILSLSAALIAVNEGSEVPSSVSKGEYLLGFVCTLGASAVYSLLLSLVQLSFQKVLRNETFSVALEMQIYTSLVATCVSTVGMFASGEWKGLQKEMEGFDSGRASYVLTLVWTAVIWQVSAVGVVGLIFTMSSLFSNVISTLSLAITPLAALIVFHDKMNGVKVIAMLLALCGFCTYIYQNYLDDAEARKMGTQSHTDDIEEPHHV